MIAAALVFYQPDFKSLYEQFFPSATPLPTSTKAPTPTPNWTATAQVEEAQSTVEDAASNWDIVIKDTFDDNENGWITETDDDDYALMTYEITEGKYRWDATAHQSFIGWIWPDMEPMTNFYLSVETQKVEGPDTADYGVLLREDEDSNFYYFGIRDSGSYALYIFFEKWETLIAWTETDLIKPNEVNRITVLAEGSHFTFFINDQYLTEYSDDRISEGHAALAVELSNEGDQAVFEFDNFEVRVP